MTLNEGKSTVAKNIGTVLISLGIAGWFQEIFSIEWSSAICGNSTDGPVSAVWGMPLPYIRWSTVSSMEYFWMPSVFFLNLLLLSGVAFPIIAWTLRRFDSKLISNLSALVGAFLVLALAGFIGLQIKTGLYKIPVTNIANDRYEYSDLRPVGFGFKSLRYQCTPLK